VAVGALGVLLWYQFLRVPATPGSAASNSQARSQTPAATGPGALPSPLRLDKMEPVPEEPESARNPFRYGVPPRPPSPPVTTSPPVVTPTPKPGPPPPPPGPPRIQLTLLGLMERPFPDGTQRRQATLRDPSGSLFHVFEGDKFDGRYKVIKVGLDSVVISYLDGSGQIALQVARTSS
jgi:hypothetical protein